MPRNGPGVYSLPDGYAAVPGEVILATQHNAPLEDIAAELNEARPIVAGGTGATSAAGARSNLGIPTQYKSVALLEASTEAVRGSGSLWVAGRSLFIEAASSATDHHLTTAGGVKLYDFGAPGSQAIGFTQLVMDRLERGEAADIVILGDSTGDASNEWPSQLAALIGAAYPAAPVSVRVWDTGSSNYGSPTSIQSGTGAGALTIWNGSVSGSIPNLLVGSAITSAVTPGTIGGDPDLVIFNYGHNGGSGLDIQVPMLAAAVGAVQRLCPLTPIIILGQNPVRSGDDTVTGTMRAKVEAFQAVAKQGGCGFINVHSFFLDYARPLVSYYNTSDTIHPNTLGSKLWAYCVWHAFQYSPDTAIGPGRTVLDRGIIYSACTYEKLSAWSAGNCTFSAEASFFETAGKSLKITGDNINAQSFASKVVIASTDITGYRGKYITLNARLRVPSGNSAEAGRVALYDGTTTVTSPNGGAQGTGWSDISVSMKVEAAATQITAYVYVSQTVASAEIVYVDRVTISDGIIPRDFSNPAGEAEAFNGQVAFPATQNASSDANTLDDYEEGSTTPTITAATGSFSSVSCALDYTKIGNRVIWNATVTITNAGTASGEMIIPLPFTNAIASTCNGFVNSTFKTVGGRVPATSGAARVSLYDATTAIATGVTITVGGNYRV